MWCTEDSMWMWFSSCVKHLFRVHSAAHLLRAEIGSSPSETLHWTSRYGKWVCACVCETQDDTLSRVDVTSMTIYTVSAAQFQVCIDSKEVEMKWSRVRKVWKQCSPLCICIWGYLLMIISWRLVSRRVSLMILQYVGFCYGMRLSSFFRQIKFIPWEIRRFPLCNQDQTSDWIHISPKPIIPTIID